MNTGKLSLVGLQKPYVEWELSTNYFGCAVFSTSIYTKHGVTHRWKYNNKTQFELSFNVHGPRWRVWTTKNIPVKWAGPWVIEVVDENNNILTQKLFYNSP